MLAKNSSAHRESIPADAGALPRSPRVVFLPNVRMTERRAKLIAEGGPDPRRESKGFSANGIHVRERDLHPFPLNPMAKKGSFLAGFDPLRALKVLLFERNADVIVSVFESNVFFILLLRAVFRFKPRIVLWEVSGRGWAKRDKVLDFVVPRVDHVFVLTQHQKKEVESLYHLRNPAEIVGFAVDDHFYSPHPSKESKDSYVLAVGDDVGRDYQTLVNACHALGLPLKLRSSTKLPNLGEAASGVTVVGRQTYDELRDLYAGARIVVVPLKSVDYPSGITAIFEALAMGKPLITSRTGTTVDFISHGENGLLVTPESPSELSNELGILWNDKVLQEKLAQNARRHLDEKFSYERYIQRFSHCLRNAMSNK